MFLANPKLTAHPTPPQAVSLGFPIAKAVSPDDESVEAISTEYEFSKALQKAVLAYQGNNGVPICRNREKEECIENEEGVIGIPTCKNPNCQSIFKYQSNNKLSESCPTIIGCNHTPHETTCTGTANAVDGVSPSCSDGFDGRSETCPLGCDYRSSICEGTPTQVEGETETPGCEVVNSIADLDPVTAGINP